MPNSPSAVVRLLARRRETNDGSMKSVSMKSSTREAALSAPRGGKLFETLEARTHLSVSKDAAGWTVVTPPSGAKVVYVSASGKDTNPGTINAPIKSISKGVGMLRTGTGDQLLLKRGDTFSGTMGFWVKSGMNAQNPLVLGTYGTGNRPVVNTGSTYAFSSGVKSGIHDVMIQGIKFVSNGAAVADGISLSGKATNIHIEDVELTKYVNNIVLQKFFGPITNVTIRRSVITDSFSRAGRNSEGLFAEAVNGLTLEENVFDHNGWGNGRGATIFNHNAYIRATCTGFTARGNVFSNASSYGLEARAGGIVENNVFIGNANHLTFGLVNGSPVTPGGVTGRVVNNFMTGTHKIGSLVRGTGIEIWNIKRGGTVVSGNVIANGGNATSYSPGIELAAGNNVHNLNQAVGINDLTLSGNVVYNWSLGIRVGSGQAPGGGPKAFNNVNVVNNHFQKINTPQGIIRASTAGNFSNNLVQTDQVNSYFKNAGGTKVAVTYADPTRTPGKMVGGSNDAYIAQVRTLSKFNWKTNILAASAVSYVKSGFSAVGTRAIK